MTDAPSIDISPPTSSNGVKNGVNKISDTGGHGSTSHGDNTALRWRQEEINGMKAFAINFEINTPVPADLLPLMAVSGEKQLEFVMRCNMRATYGPQAEKGTGNGERK
ncbi:hypothetical protein CC80DRAFT_552645 [Byssothecium circinans]|uniref:Uncharacterized protein n=1 Tax=Byssothecium circinans TaxID=147558 RepID=A0A6A5TKG6_9PLEO|nr:hypothetical protein CC80DRAFT_552645 [Byssothecium circinans]